jgi:hypothetical protein
MKKMIILVAILISAFVVEIALADNNASLNRTAFALDSKNFVVVKDLSEKEYHSRILLFGIRNGEIVLKDSVELREIQHSTNRTTKIFRNPISQ